MKTQTIHTTASPKITESDFFKYENFGISVDKRPDSGMTDYWFIRKKRIGNSDLYKVILSSIYTRNEVPTDSSLITYTSDIEADRNMIRKWDKTWDSMKDETVLDEKGLKKLLNNINKYYIQNYWDAKLTSPYSIRIVLTKDNGEKILKKYIKKSPTMNSSPMKSTRKQQKDGKKMYSQYKRMVGDVKQMGKQFDKNFKKLI